MTTVTFFKSDDIICGFEISGHSDYAEEGSDIVEGTDDLNRVNPELANCVGDTSIALSILADNQDFFEVKAENY